ncbi:coiled-coil domain-containing protein 13 isoform X4 [Hemicordylus capensis]|uniref:coiled-coil domain-containing protein 13 isoform X4 n=1 Tax=Hemicordylus capensis TaxID=884348 RepID=UPI00230242AB|nr:coiled-coil domain-containing protein 13 isoform X4 [Hemicordylus capensis]
MELDEEVNENLKMQFKALQEQQQKRMQNLMEKKKEKQQSLKTNSKDNQEESFGVQDNLDLSSLDSPMLKEDIRKRLLEDENEQLQNQLRETVDENGRLYKLLKERDFEIKQLQKKIEEERMAMMGTAGLAGDVAATKIVELAKRNRHLTAEIEREKTRVKQLNNRIKELDKELQMSTVKLQSVGDKNNQPARKTGDMSLDSSNNSPFLLNPESPEMKVLQEKLSAANLKVSEYRNQLQTTKQELKMTQKLFANEVGEDVNIQNLLSTPGTWRGRAQQILVLQGKVRELENQLGHSKSRLSESCADGEVLSHTNSRKRSAQEKNLQHIRTLEKEKKEALEKLTNEYNAFKKDQEDVKKKLDSSKARNKMLSSEVKTLKEQISTLLDKGKHDDELIDALLSQQKEMQIILKNLSQQDKRNKECRQSLGQQLNIEAQKQTCLIEQLKQMVAEREARVRELEEKVRQLASQHHRNQTEENNSDSTSTLSSESLEGENCAAGSRRDDCIAKNSSARTVEPDTPDMKTLKVQIVEYKALSQAAQVERDRLIELVSILQKRVDESTTKIWEAEKKFQDQQQRYVVLEQQFEKLKMEAGKTSSTQKIHSKGKAAGSASAVQPLSNTRLSWNAGDQKDLLSEVPLESQIEEVSTRLAIQVEENESLKSALQTTMKTKEEDFRVYQETMGQVKEIFLQALRQQKQDRI